VLKLDVEGRNAGMGASANTAQARVMPQRVRSECTAHGDWNRENKVATTDRGARNQWLSVAKGRSLAGHPQSCPPIAFRARRQEVFVTTRSRRETLTFKHPFRLEGIDRTLPAGLYDVVTDEEMIEGLSFAVFRRVTTMITVPCAPPHQASVELISIGSIDLANAQRIDAATP